MKSARWPSLLLVLLPLALHAHPADVATLAPPDSIELDGPPPVSAAVAASAKRYLEYRSAAFLGWDDARHAVLMKTRFGSTNQLHVVSQPGGARTQLSFENEPIAYASSAPRRGDVTVVQKDSGGQEYFQLYRLSDGALELLTDGKSRNNFGAWSKDGRFVGYASTRRDGVDTDLYLIDPRDARSDRLLAKVQGSGWNIADFSEDGTHALVVNRLSIARSELHELDIRSGTMRRIDAGNVHAAYVKPHYAKDGTLWTLSDAGSDFQRLGTIDPRNGKFTAVATEAGADVTDFAIAPDGSFVVYALNQDGFSKVRLLAPGTGQVRTVTALPDGVIPYSLGDAIAVAANGEIGLSLSAADVPGDVYSIDPTSLQVRRWTYSETGGLDPARNAKPQLLTIKSFDGEPISGFLYLPDDHKFPGKHPLLVSIHGGPEGQWRPDYLGTDNYLLNELGIALFYPNVRGSDGYGKRFLSLDDGPFKREDSVKDIGAFLDRLASDARLDSRRFAVTGVSYGGYMCYASAFHFGPRLKAASCYVGISNFVTFLEHTNPYRRDLRRPEYGDERDPVQRRKLEQISPLNHVDEISIPLLVATGANDQRVPATEAEQIIARVRSKGGTAWHLLARNEGHGFQKKENADYYFLTSVMFWTSNLLTPQNTAADTQP